MMEECAMESYEPHWDANSALAQLSAIGLEIASHAGSTNVFQTLNRHARRLLGAESFQAYLFDADKGELTLAFGADKASPHEERHAEHHIALDEPHALVARCARERRRLVIESASDDSGDDGLPPQYEFNALYAPLLMGDRLLGVISARSHTSHRHSDHEKMTFWTLGIYCTLALDNIDTHKQLNVTLSTLRDTVVKKLETELACQRFKEASLTDSLTGLRNRRFLQEQIESDAHLCMRRYEQWLRQPASPKPFEADLLFFLIDIDHFKEVNDTYSHAIGDMVLVQMRERLQEVTRDYDYLIRWGGEEFLIVARQTDRRHAELIAERIRAAVASRPFELPDGVQLTKTCSVGFACYPHVQKRPRMHSWSDVVDLADRELYKAKSSGRNAWSGLLGNEPAQGAPMPTFVPQMVEPDCDAYAKANGTMNLSIP
jgi:diguanylate cyclase (GGDEF)-like protein